MQLFKYVVQQWCRRVQGRAMPDTAATAFAAVAAPTGPPAPAGPPGRARLLGPIRPATAPPVDDADPPASTEPPELAGSAPDDLDRPDRRARRRRTLALVGLVSLGLAATATLMAAGVMFLRGPTTHTIPFLSDARGNGPVVEPRDTHPGQPGKAGGPAGPPTSPSQRRSATPGATASAAPSTSPGNHWPESANRSTQPGQQWVCTLTRRGLSCVPAVGAGPSGSPSPAPSWSNPWSDQRDR
jgi:hypothetical protein